jgi:hypothetical protein
MNNIIKIIPKTCNKNDIIKAINVENETHQSGIKLEKGPILRGGESTILLAILSLGNASLGALIAGLLSLLKQQKANQVTLKGKNGATIIIPESASPEKVDYWIRKAKELDIERITI